MVSALTTATAELTAKDERQKRYRVTGGRCNTTGDPYTAFLWAKSKDDAKRRFQDEFFPHVRAESAMEV